MVRGSRSLSLNEVSIIDYGLGNLRSVENALRAIGAPYRFVRDAGQIKEAGRLLLPGVGTFPAGMRNLRATGLIDAIREAAAQGTPVLGICLGMQLLVSRGDEGEGAEGLDLIPGLVQRFTPSAEVRIPHMGFNEAEVLSFDPLFANIKNGSDFYFVHSYHVVVEAEENAIAMSTHGQPFVAAIRHGNVFGTQFHPEKSQSQGLQLLRNFCAFE